ncbi:SDR family NAD(P)-dependent oxidoreductase, partial [Streptomyces hyaluromycini]
MTALRTVLVTGTSSGIGLATAVRAAETGWHVVATLREPGRDGA